MRHRFFVAVSAIALLAQPAISQEAKSSQRADGTPCEDIGAAASASQNELIASEQKRRPADSASAGKNIASGQGEPPFPPQDVSDDDLEPSGADYPSGYPDEEVWSAMDANDGDSPQFQEGEVVPEGVRRYQREDVWEGEGELSNNLTGRSSPAEESRRSTRTERADAERGGSSDVGDDGETSSVPPAASRTSNGQGMQDRSTQSMQDRSGPRVSERMDRRERLARRAQRSATYAVPEARFNSYRFEVENGRRVIEIAGIDRNTGRQIEVDVYSNGRVESISTAIDLDEVPDDVRAAVREEFAGFRVAVVRRSMLSDFDIYYEFAGVAPSGRPAAASIRADGTDLQIRFAPRS